jgi:O-methyltransferase
MVLKSVVRRNVKMMLAPLLYRNYPIGLEEPRFYLWMDALYKTRHLSSPVVEVGVAAGGTSAFSFNFLRQIDSQRDYICVDTFGGFTEEQFAEDVRLGNDWKNFSMFSANSPSLVRKVLKMHGAEGVRLIQGDISKVDKARFPKSISACLLDVDLAIPIYDGLSLVWPLLEAGGVIVVDDCLERQGENWQALIGYRKFCQEMALDQHFFYGAAYLVKGNPSAEGFPSSSR